MTFDIYTNRIPTGLLTNDERGQLQTHAGRIETFHERYGWVSLSLKPRWGSNTVYRAVRPAPTKPSINWDHVAYKWKWLTRDENGEAFIYEQMPSTGTFKGMWSSEGNLFCISEILSSYKPGTCDWKDSLVMRPGYEGE